MQLQMPRNKTVIILMLMVAGVFAGTFRAMSDADIWFQLLAGKYVLNHWAVPHTDFFIYSAQNAPQMFGGWGFGLIYELAITAFGLPAATFVNATIWTLAFVFAMSTAFMRAKVAPSGASRFQLMLMMMVISALFISMGMRMSMRAESTLVLAWVLSLWLYEHFGSARIKWVMAGLPIIAWAEAWLHTGGFVLLAILPICIARHMGTESLTRRQWMGWSLCALGMLTLPVLNPNGFMQVYIQFKSIFLILFSEAQNPIASFTNLAQKDVNLEYVPIWDSRAVALWPNFLVLSVLTAVIVIRRPNRSWIVEAAVCCFFLGVAALHIRGMSLAGMALMVPAMERALSVTPNRKTENRRNLCLLATVMLCLIPWATAYTLGNWAIQSSVNVLDREAALIKKTHPHGANIFTNEIGPQLLYALGDERFKVSKGGHTIIPNDAVNAHYSKTIQGLDGWTTELNDMHVDFIMLPFYIPLAGEGMFYWLPSQVVTRDDWQLLLYNQGVPLFNRMPVGEKLSEELVDTQTLIYLKNMRVFGKYSIYGRADTLGNDISAIALTKIEEIEEKRKSRRDDVGSPLK